MEQDFQAWKPMERLEHEVGKHSTVNSVSGIAHDGYRAAVP